MAAVGGIRIELFCCYGGEYCNVMQIWACVYFAISTMECLIKIESKGWLSMKKYYDDGGIILLMTNFLGNIYVSFSISTFIMSTQFDAEKI